MKARQLTDGEAARLRPHEETMRCALQRRWMRWPGTEAVKEALEIWQAVHGATWRMSTGCSRCVLSLFTDLGRLYFAREAEKAASRRRARK